MSFIRVYKPDSYEYEQLRIAAEMMTAKSATGVEYRVEETYFDFGQGWRWTTIIAHRCGDSWQAITPREQEAIIWANDLDKETDRWFANDEWGLDRRK